MPDIAAVGPTWGDQLHTNPQSKREIPTQAPVDQSRGKGIVPTDRIEGFDVHSRLAEILSVVEGEGIRNWDPKTDQYTDNFRANPARIAFYVISYSKGSSRGTAFRVRAVSTITP